MLSKMAVGACTLAAAAGFAGSASAASGGNFIATGHDMDYHCSYGDPNECAYLKIAVDKVRNGSSLPILALDQGGTPTCVYYDGYGEYCYGGAELVTALGDAGFSSSDIVHVDPTSSQFATMPFVDSNGKPLYSAIITASDQGCGGCDDNSAGEAAIDARASDFTTYFNAGGGILALAGADNSDQYYGFVPLHVSGAPTSSPYTVTPDGAAIGVTYSMANCCATHNSFDSVPSGMVALETDSSGVAETLAAFDATITTGGGDGGGGFSSGPPAEDPITVASQPVSATEGQSFSGTVATVSGDSDSAASDYTVSIDWGDGSTSSGSVDASGNVTGSHTYAEEGSYTVKTTVTDADDTSNTASDSSTATVADAALTAGQMTASGGTEGTGGGSVSFSFTDANPNATASDFTASVDWGDGSTSAGTVSQNADGSFSVSAPGHSYAEEGKDPVTVSVSDDGGQTTSGTQDATVADAPLTAGQMSASGGTEGTGGGSASFSFTDANPNATASDFTATVDWGDGSSSAGTVTQNADGSFAVSAPGHTYADEGKDTVTVSVSDAGGATTSASQGVTVGDAPLTAGHVSASGGTEGTGGGSASFSFTDANPKATVSDFTATVDWGDGSSSTGTVTQNADGSFSVTAPTHTYAEEGKDTVTVSVSDDGGQTTSGSQDVTVADAALTAQGKPASISQPAYTGTLASFTDANPNASTADFTATVDWGDGSSSAGKVTSNASGGFDVSGSHSYASTGPYTVKVHVADDGGSTADASTQVLVYQYAAAGGGSFAIGDKNAAVGTQVTFWGAQWAGANSLSSGSAPASFKGFGSTPSGTAPACGGSYTTGPGGSSNPPATIPAYMAVYVSSSVGKQGSTITGNIAHIVIVKTDPGYQNQPGNTGTGKVVATVC